MNKLIAGFYEEIVRAVKKDGYKNVMLMNREEFLKIVDKGKLITTSDGKWEFFPKGNTAHFIDAIL